uniref:non-specific serine/threonine protein kinase n=1 Tax=Ditylum brightwellii TaxID=49249 RepID=A0A7S4VT91_9STRA
MRYPHQSQIMPRCIMWIHILLAFSLLVTKLPLSCSTGTSPLIKHYAPSDHPRKNVPRRNHKAREMRRAEQFSTEIGSDFSEPVPSQSSSDASLPISSPTSPRSQICSDGFSLIRIFLTPDDFEEEMRWMLSNSRGAIIYGFDYSPITAAEDYGWESCVPEDDCYSFTIEDDWGDGICCSHGEGSYSLWYDDVKVASGGDFEFSESRFFGANCPTFSPSASSRPSSKLPRLQPLVSEHAEIIEKERDTLIKLFESTRGEEWLVNTGWIKEDENHCKWEGVSCKNGFVNKLTLEAKGLDGSIPTDVGMLSNLRYLYLAENKIHGSIPTEIGMMESLEILELNLNAIDGTVPTEVGRIERLNYLSFSDNTLHGNIPTEVGMISNLGVFSLSANNLHGTVPTEIGMIKNLKHLHISENNLHGTLPTEIGMMKSLEIIFLQENTFHGTIPTEIGMLGNLIHLLLHDNSLSGTIPTEIGMMENLNTLHISRNSINGTIPTKIGMMEHFAAFILSRNSINGTIPTEIGMIKSLKFFFLDHNFINGIIPTEIGLIESLHFLFLSDNFLNSTIPTEVGLLSKLNGFQIFSNNIYGTIPTEIGRLQDLEQALNLSSSFLTGTVPTELGMLTKIDTLDLSSNSLTSVLPTHLVNMSSLEYLNVSNNKFVSFPLEEEWNNILETCDMSHNQIEQEIPKELLGFSSLKVLIISNNSFIGTLPDSLGSLARMQRLHLDNNLLSGTIPDTILALATLSELNLSNNRQETRCFHDIECTKLAAEYQQGHTVCCNDICSDIVDTDGISTFCLLLGLRGAIPAGFGNMLTLELLDLSSNYFAGNIPPEIGRLSRLEVLNLTNNVLTGSIPSALGALASASVLLKGNDQIRGKHGNKIAPLSLCSSVPGLDIFNDPIWCPPERNALKKIYDEAGGQDWIRDDGWVDEFNNHCTWYGIECNEENNVIKLALENSGLSGRISNSVASLTSLETLHLRDNNLKGSIPYDIGKLLNLSSLQLSHNFLTGSIPPGFLNLSQLEMMHLHGNRLRGTVPILASKGINESSFIADCGSPSDFDTPVDCPNCTMCCNRLQQCDTQEEIYQVETLAIKVMFGVLGFLILVAMTSLLRKRKMTLDSSPFHFIFGLCTRKESSCDVHDAIGKDSVYCFFLSSNFIAWVLAIAVLFAQGVCFVFFIQAASLDFGAEKDWVYQR